jgi:hypothetical protein
VFIRVAEIDPGLGTATIRVWDIPEGSLRKEDSKPKVFLIENAGNVGSPHLKFYLPSARLGPTFEQCPTGD